MAATDVSPPLFMYSVGCTYKDTTVNASDAGDTRGPSSLFFFPGKIGHAAATSCYHMKISPDSPETIQTPSPDRAQISPNHIPMFPAEQSRIYLSKQERHCAGQICNVNSKKGE